jgi:hypothetical protein
MWSYNGHAMSVERKSPETMLTRRTDTRSPRASSTASARRGLSTAPSPSLVSLV